MSQLFGTNEPLPSYPSSPSPAELDRLASSPAARIARCYGRLQGILTPIDVVAGATAMVLPRDPSRVMYWLSVPGGETFAIGGQNGVQIVVGNAQPTPNLLLTVDSHYVATQDELWIIVATGNQTIPVYVVKGTF